MNCDAVHFTAHFVSMFTRKISGYKVNENRLKRDIIIFVRISAECATVFECAKLTLLFLITSLLSASSESICFAFIHMTH